jgi:uncharacterized membrane protein YeaQ/YmgE (transglycosylase-associated protein family)
VRSKGEKIMLLLLWIVAGLGSGYVTGRVMSSEGRDWVMNLIMGVAGGIGGGFLLSATHIVVRGAMIYTSLAAIAGAALLAGVSRSLSGRREYGSTERWIEFGHPRELLCVRGIARLCASRLSRGTR